MSRLPSSQRGYDAKWRRIRAQFLKAYPTCSVRGCGRPATDVHHKITLAKGGTHAWSNLAALCHPHHSVQTASHDMSRNTTIRGCDVNGMPLDPAHPWRR